MQGGVCARADSRGRFEVCVSDGSFSVYSSFAFCFCSSFHVWYAFAAMVRESVGENFTLFVAREYTV
jgi:hypothetical protein